MTMTGKWNEIAMELGAIFGERAEAHDRSGTFVADNYALLKERRFMSALVPQEFGGGGAAIEEICEALRVLAHHCPSTALSLSMHSHLVAAAAFKHKLGKPTKALLEKVAAKELVLVSTGATDWIDGNGTAVRVEGGYRVSGRKVFGSGSPVADLLITSCAEPDGPDGPAVIHFPVAFSAEGVSILEDWDTMGMRGTGSNTVLFDNVFVPEASVALRRPQGQWHPAWNVVLGVAPALYMAPYIGLAEAAVELAVSRARKRPGREGVVDATGQMLNELASAHLAWRELVRGCAGYDFVPGLEHANQNLVYKTLVTRAVKKTVELAMEVAGGASFYRALPLERLWRDAQACHFHPLPERRQIAFSGKVALGMDPGVR